MSKLPRRTISFPSDADVQGVEREAKQKDTTVSRILWPAIRKIAEPHKKKEAK